MLFRILLAIAFPTFAVAGPFSQPRAEATTALNDRSATTDSFVTENIVLGTATPKYSAPPIIYTTRTPSVSSSTASPNAYSSFPIEIQSTTEEPDSDEFSGTEEPWPEDDVQKVEIYPNAKIQRIPLTSIDGRTARATIYVGEPPQRLNVSFSTFYDGFWVPEVGCYRVAAPGSDAFNRSVCAGGPDAQNVYRPALSNTQIEKGFFQSGRAVGRLMDDDAKFGDVRMSMIFGSVTMVEGVDSGLLGLAPAINWEQDSDRAEGLFQTAWKEGKIRKPLVAFIFNYANDSGIGEGPDLRRADAGQIIVGNDAPDHCEPSLDSADIPHQYSVRSDLPDFAGWVFTSDAIGVTREVRNLTVDLNSDMILGPLDEVRQFVETLKEFGATEVEEGRFAVKCSAEFSFGFSALHEIKIPSHRLLRRKCEHCKELEDGICHLAIIGLKSKTPSKLSADWIIGGQLLPDRCFVYNFVKKQFAMPLRK